jgi:hypothetical protein
MKQILIALMLVMAVAAKAQTDSTAFRAHIYNKEYDVSMHLNFYDQDIEVPGMELFGQLPGYLTNGHSVFCWLVTEAEMEDDHAARLVMVNESGSEDLTASLTQVNDSTYTLHQLKGSTLKVLKGKKWQKLPSNMTFIRKK